MRKLKHTRQLAKPIPRLVLLLSATTLVLSISTQDAQARNRKPAARMRAGAGQGAGGGASSVAQSGSANGQSPVQVVQGHMSAFAEIVKSPKADRVTILRDRVRQAFDFPRFAQQTMGKRWKTMSKKERQRLQKVVRTLVEKNYLKNPDKIFADNKVLITGDAVNGQTAEVNGTLEQEDVDIEIVLKMRNKKGVWVAYDVVFDEMSLLEDYQYQFRTYLQKKNMKQLLAKLESKAAEP